MRIPGCYWIKGVGRGKSARPCIVLYDEGSWMLIATGTSQYHPERGRVIKVSKGQRLGKTWRLSQDTYFDPFSFTTKISHDRLPSDSNSNWVPRQLADDLFNLLLEAAEANEMVKDDPRLSDVVDIVKNPEEAPDVEPLADLSPILPST